MEQADCFSKTIVKTYLTYLNSLQSAVLLRYYKNKKDVSNNRS